MAKYGPIDRMPDVVMTVRAKRRGGMAGQCGGGVGLARVGSRWNDNTLENEREMPFSGQVGKNKTFHRLSDLFRRNKGNKRETRWRTLVCTSLLV